MISQVHPTPTIGAWHRVAAVAFGLLLISVASASAQAPSTSTGRQLVRANIAECVRRAEAAFSAEGFRINGTGESWAYGIRSPIQGGVTCLAAPDGNTWASLFVAGNGITGAVAGEQRTRLLRLIENPAVASSAGSSPNPGGGTMKLCGWTVSRPVHNKWQQLGGENGMLGCAISDEKEAQRSPMGTAGTVVFFGKPGGFMYHITSGRHMEQVHAVSAVIGQKFSELGDTGSWLGYPISDQVSVPQGLRSNFEGGYIVWDRGTRKAAAYRNNP